VVLGHLHSRWSGNLYVKTDHTNGEEAPTLIP
jgi:hypothetical protein